MPAPVTYRNATHAFILDGHNTDEYFKVLLEQFTHSTLQSAPLPALPPVSYLNAFPRRACGAWRVDLLTLTAEFISFGPGGARPLTAQLRARPEGTPGSARVSLPDLGALPRDWRPVRWPALRLPTETVPVSLLGQPDSGVGRQRDVRRARVSAQLEALERRSSVYAGQPLVRGACRPLAADRRVLDPGSLVQLDVPGAVAYSPDLEIDWVSGVSLRSGEEILVPARHVFMGYGADPAYLNESSSGCALGSVPEEAMLYAALEVIERDAFLMAWYTRTGAVLLDLTLLTDPDTLILLDDLRFQGFEVQAFDITPPEEGVPVVWVLGRGRRAGQPSTLTALAAHLDPVRALRGALEELHVGLGSSRVNAGLGGALHRGERAVVTHLDHFEFYAHPAGDAFLRFLPDVPDCRATRAFLRRGAAWRDPDITVNLRRLTDRLLRSRPDVVFVDIGAPVVSALGLSCVRAVVPDSLPLTFGQAGRRVRGCRRLRRRLAGRPFNDAPHPFP
ncbi:hypothetical protein GCM10017784_36670 [Deinococcus indicus]|uniref:YcaO-like family protein n=1 Tax=Deinococcus indicus TaxID=223556 RepID=UPI001748C8A9|nr:YcaO-like family protein [Deinococcus indicus]GHG38665.1 hypothetical protein GCM10017784_36670 [Deinococcus indicus]